MKLDISYEEYLQTEHWKIISEETKRLAGYRCQICNSPDHLNAHHRTYDRIGNELQSDLTCLCKDCHALFHDKLGDEDGDETQRMLAVGAIYMDGLRTAIENNQAYRGDDAVNEYRTMQELHGLALHEYIQKFLSSKKTEWASRMAIREGVRILAENLSWANDRGSQAGG